MNRLINLICILVICVAIYPITWVNVSLKGKTCYQLQGQTRFYWAKDLLIEDGENKYLILMNIRRGEVFGSLENFDKSRQAIYHQAECPKSIRYHRYQQFQWQSSGEWEVLKRNGF